MTAVNQLFELIYGTVMAIIGLGGVAFGGWALYDGFTNDQPEAKKRGITTIIVVMMVLVFMGSAKGIVLSMIPGFSPTI